VRDTLTHEISSVAFVRAELRHATAGRHGAKS